MVSELRPQGWEGGTQKRVLFCEAFLRCVEKKMGAINSELEELFEAKKRVKNPYVPIGISSIPLFFPTHMRLHTDIYIIYDISALASCVYVYTDTSSVNEVNPMRFAYCKIVKLFLL